MKSWMIGVGSILGLGLLVNSLGKTQSTPNQPLPPPRIPPTNPDKNKLGPGDHIWFWNGKISKAGNIPQQEWFGTTAPNDYAGHGNQIYYYVIYENEVRRGQPHLKSGQGSFAWLHNNPGNITGPQPNFGQYPDKYGWHNFLIFPNYNIGFDAIGRYLRGNRYSNLSIVQAFNVYAPKSDGGNQPDKYAAEVANAAGVNIQTKISELSDSQLRLMQEKIAQIEGTVPGKILSLQEFSNEILQQVV